MQSERFLRISRLLGEDVVEILHGKFVVIVGLGAVGGYALEALTRSGIGRLRLVDFDTVSVTNLNRQILALESTIGRKKVDVAKERVLDINPEAQVQALEAFAHEQTLSEILAGEPDLVIDAIDSLNPKCALLQGTYERGIPLISSMGAALRRDPSLVRTADLMDTWGCPLARQVRTNLRKRGVGRGIQVVFSPELVRFAYRPPEEEEHADFNEQIIDRGRRRNVLGSLPTVTGIFGLTLAHLALDNLVGGDALHGEAAWNPVAGTEK
ncbi:MAG: tRNA threonylcarbamoyladenosine dehydratase [Sphaerochaetaceae bacterium]|jgi:tRNA A37 threonylcarbamoyladenosine dehydratase